MEKWVENVELILRLIVARADAKLMVYRAVQQVYSVVTPDSMNMLLISQIIICSVLI